MLRKTEEKFKNPNYHSRWINRNWNRPPQKYSWSSPAFGPTSLGKATWYTSLGIPP